VLLIGALNHQPGYFHETRFQRAYSPFNWEADAHLDMSQIAVSTGHRPEVSADD